MNHVRWMTFWLLNANNMRSSKMDFHCHVSAFARVERKRLPPSGHVNTMQLFMKLHYI